MVATAPLGALMLERLPGLFEAITGCDPFIKSSKIFL